MTTNRLARVLIGCLLAALVGEASAATLSGQVTADGKPLAGAWVQLNTGLIAVTDARGRYSFAQVPLATYALQAFAPGKEPGTLTAVVPGRSRADFALSPAGVPLGLVHVKATTPDGALRPVRIVTRWRAAEGAEWQTPGEPRYASTLDGRGRPYVPAAEDQASIVPFGACLWTQGEAVMALPPGQAELTCTAGVLMRAAQQTVGVKPNEAVEVAVSMTLGSELGSSGWRSGALHVEVGGDTSEAAYLVNIPLAAAICRAEGYDWVVLGEPYGNDPAQASPRQVVAEVSGDKFAVWLAPEVPASPRGGRRIAVGQDQPLPPAVPGYYAGGLLKRAVALYAEPLGPEPARELPFEAVADPRLVPLLDLPPAGPTTGDSLKLWTLLVEHGLRVGCAAVGDARLDLGRLPLPERTFVQMGGALGSAAVVSALQRGATFVTTGPALSLTIGDARPGGTLPADDKTCIADLDAVLGCVPTGGVARVELVRNGAVARTWDVSDVGPNHVQARIAVRENQPAWFALRAYGADASQVAYTSPIYFIDPNAPPPTAREARIEGTVFDDATGAPIAGAKVTATAPGGRPVSTTTGADGRYALVAPATAMLEVSHPRYPKADSAKFVAWDCPTVRAALESVTADSLLTWEQYRLVEEALTAPTVDFRPRAR
ncbi:MAG: carboxypeptidase regulatory-like domain-containing protein [Armatimonadetes bacterium]|nr:carboxypeptidase regulatory-like domain-containing protein [Armatimonadota bacterium]